MRYFLFIFFLTCFAVVAVCGFRGSHSRRPPIELFADMVRQNKVRPQSPGEFFPDRFSSRSSGRHRAHTALISSDGQVLKIDGQPVFSYEDSPVNTGRIRGTTNWVAGQSPAHYPRNCWNGASSATKSIACPATAPTATARASPANTA